MSYTLELSPAAKKKDLKKLPITIQKDIVFKHLQEIQFKPYKKGSPLSGTFIGERS